jgi:hypothetical protein
MRRAAALLLPLLAGLSACIPNIALREPTSPDHGGIVMALSFKGEEFPYWLRHKAAELFFAKVLPDGSLDPKLVPANYRAGDRVYALDLPPGKYALVAASYFTGRTRQLARFQGDKAKTWVVEVKPGQLVFGGAAQVNRRFPGWDVFFMNGLRRMASYLPPFKRAVIPVETGLAKTDRSRGVELQALRLARADLSGSAWSLLAEDKIREYGDPPPVITVGMIRKKPVPPKRAQFFSWMDTLEWGAPRPVTGGLEWSRPKSHAWVSVSFVPAEGPGARPMEQELSSLREAGAPEDMHALVSVQISSRPAYAIRYTTYLYGEASLVGADVSVLRTEAVVVPAKDGYYKLQYRAARPEFDRFRPEFAHFVRYLDLAPPPPPDKT